MTAVFPLRFGMPEDERRRLTGENGHSDRRRGGRRRGDPMDGFTIAMLAMMGSVVATYCIIMLIAPDRASSATQGLLAIIPAGTLLIVNRKDRNGD